MSDSSPDSPAVIAYRLAQVEKAVSEGNSALNDKLDALVQGFVTKEFYLEQHTTLAARVRSLENDRTWIIRLVGGAVVMALLALIGVGLKLNP